MSYGARADIVRVQRAVLTITGGEEGDTWSPPVSAIDITLEPSSIPTISVHVAPGFSVNDTSESPQKPSLHDFNVWLKRAMLYTVDGKARASLSVLMEGNDTENHLDMELKGWHVIGAGLSGASAGGGTYLSITLAHPVYALSRTSGGIGNQTKKTEFNRLKGAAGKGVIKALELALLDWLDTPRESLIPDTICTAALDMADGDAAKDWIIEQLKAGAEAIGRVVEWNTALPMNRTAYKTWPEVGNCLGEYIDSIVHSISLFASGMDGSSIFDKLGTLFQEFQLAMIPTFWRPKLQVMPFTPWAYPSIIIKEDEIAHIEFPPVDPAPISGIRMPYVTSGGTESLNFIRDTPGAGGGYTAEMFYIPPKLLESGLVGAIPVASPPFWWNYAQEHNAGQGGGLEYIESAEGLGPEAAPEASGVDSNRSREAFVGALPGIARQYFLTYFKQQVEVALVTPLRVKSWGSEWEDNWTTPGCVVSVSTQEHDTILDFYATKIVHSIDIEKSTAITTWKGNWCRPEEGYPGIAVNGDYNPMYL